MEDEGQVGEDGGYPHEDEHLDADVGTDVELVLGGEGNLGGEADRGRDDGGDGDEDGGDGANEREGEAEPAGAQDQGRGQHEDKVDDGGGREEDVHDAGAQLEEVEDGGHLGRESDTGAREELPDEHLDWVEPVEGLWLGAIRDASVITRVEVSQGAPAAGRDNCRTHSST